MVHHGLWIMYANDTFSCFLHSLRSVPGFINVPGRKSPQNGQVASARTDGRCSERAWMMQLPPRENITHTKCFSKCSICTVCNLHWGQFVGQNQRDSSNGRTAGRKSCRRATSSCLRSHSSLHPAAAPQTPEHTPKKISC